MPADGFEVYLCRLALGCVAAASLILPSLMRDIVRSPSWVPRSSASFNVLSDAALARLQGALQCLEISAVNILELIDTIIFECIEGHIICSCYS